MDPVDDAFPPGAKVLTPLPNLLREVLTVRSVEQGARKI
jgi:hypothetical protein